MEALSAALSARRMGSFSAAADELGLTHAAISRRVAAAEAWSGVKLFDRGARGVSTTTDGERVLARIEAALEQVALASASDKKRHSLSTVKIACTPAFARFWLLGRLRSLEGQPADVRLELLPELRLADLPAGEADLAIRYGRGGWRQGAEDRLSTDRLVPVASTELLQGTGRKRSPADLLALPLLHDGELGNWRHWVTGHGLAFRPKAGDRNLGSYALALDAAAQGLGLALWKKNLHVLPPGLSAVDDLEVTGTLGYFLLQPEKVPRSASSRVAERIKAAWS